MSSSDILWVRGAGIVLSQLDSQPSFIPGRAHAPRPGVRWGVLTLFLGCFLGRMGGRFFSPGPGQGQWWGLLSHPWLVFPQLRTTPEPSPELILPLFCPLFPCPWPPHPLGSSA